MGFGGISERFRILGVWSDASSLFLDWVFRALEIVLRNVVIQGDCDSGEFYWQIYMTSWDFNWFWGFQRYVYDRLFFLGVLGILGSHYVGEYLSKLKKPKEEIVSLNSCNSKISFVLLLGFVFWTGIWPVIGCSDVCRVLLANPW